MTKESKLFIGQYRVWLPQKIGDPFAKEPDLIIKNVIAPVSNPAKLLRP